MNMSKKKHEHFKREIWTFLKGNMNISKGKCEHFKRIWKCRWLRYAVTMSNVCARINKKNSYDLTRTLYLILLQCLEPTNMFTSTWIHTNMNTHQNIIIIPKTHQKRNNLVWQNIAQWAYLHSLISSYFLILIFSWPHPISSYFHILTSWYPDFLIFS